MSIGYYPLKRYHKSPKKSNNNSHLGGLPEFLEWTAPAAVGTCFGGDPKMLPLGGRGRWVRKWEMGPPIQGHNTWRMRKMMETFRVIDVWPHLWCDVIARSSSWSDNPLGIFQRGAATFSVPCKLTQSKNQWKIPSCPKILAFPHVPQSVHSVHVRQFTPVYPEAISSACTRRPPRWNAISPSPRVETQRCHGASWYCWDDHPTDTGHPGDMVKLKRSKNEKMGRSWKVPSSTSIYFRMITNHNMRKWLLNSWWKRYKN